MANFNKTLLGKNVKYLAAQKGIKVGDLENQVDVSIGYFSRLLNEDGKNSSTLMDTICKVAEKLDTSVNTLISTDISALTPNEEYLSKFFDKLEKDTSNCSLIWDLETKKQLDECLTNGNHPLFYPDNPNDYRTAFHYQSKFDTDVEIAGDCYKVQINSQELYFVKVKNKDTSKTGFEMYFISEGFQTHIENICRAYSDSDLYMQIDDLYKSAAESSRHVKLSPSARNSIDEYMNPIPF